jgi:hypothetical protein
MACQHENPERPGLRCQREAHRQEENHSAKVDGAWVVWRGAGEAPFACELRASREGNAREDEQAGARYDNDRGRESWRPDNDARNWRWL